MNRLSSVVNVEKVPTALILGGTNFLGSHLCDSLISQGCRVICVDDPNELGYANISHLRDNKSFQLVSESEISLPKNSFEYAFCFKEKYFNLVSDLRVRRWLLFSSKPDQLLLSQAQSKGLNLRLVCARQIFGPRMSLRGSSFISRLVKGVFLDQKIVLPGDGSVKIYPLFVKDLISGLTAAMFMPRSRDQLFYFAGEEITAFSFAKIWTDYYRPDLEIVFDQGAVLPRLGYLAKVAETQMELDWKEATPLEAGVESTVVWFKRLDIKQLFSSKTKVALPKISKEKQTKQFSWKEVKLDSKSEFISESQQKKILNPQSSDGAGQVQSLPRIHFGDDREKKVVGEQKRDFFDLSHGEQDLPVPVEEQSQISVVDFKEQSSGFPKEPKKEPKKRAKKLPFLIMLAGLLILGGVFSPFLSLARDIFLGLGNLKEAQQLLSVGSFEKGEDKAVRAQNYFVQAERTSEKLSSPLGVILGEGNSLVFSRYLTLGIKASSALSYGSAAGQKMGLVLETIILGKEGNLSDLLDEGSLLLERVYFDLVDILATSKDLRIPSRYSSLLLGLPTTIDDLELAINTLPLLKDFLGKEKQTLLVLFQNNMELRPTGGFIGSYGLLTFDTGSLIDFSVHDVYEADGQLYGHVEPPPALKKYLGETGWYLRDSNWSPDFPVSAQQAAWFFDKEMKCQVDGVLAINLKTIQELLVSMGEIYLPDYDETIDSRNLFERAEYHSEVGFFPGSTQKKDFLAAVSFALMERLKKGTTSWLSVLKAMEHSLVAKDILVYFNDPQLSAAVSELNFDGGIKDVYCQGENCLTDYLFLVDANVGANKANFFVQRRLGQRLALSDKGVSHSVRLNYQNTAQSETWPGGKYKNYWRAFLPVKAILESIYLENQQGERTKVENWDEEEEAGKKVIGTLISVPIKDSLTIEITYRIDVDLTKADKKQLAFLFQKQSGADFDEDIILVSYPSDWLPLSVSPEGTVTPGAITYHNTLKRGDSLLEIEWGKQ